jgi:hypothetical protein
LPPHKTTLVLEGQSSSILAEIGIGTFSVGGHEYRPNGYRWIGIWIDNIKPSSIASEAGLKNGDIVLSVNGESTLPQFTTCGKMEAHFANLMNKKNKLKLVVRRFHRLSPLLYDGVEVWWPPMPEDIEIEISIA